MRRGEGALVTLRHVTAATSERGLRVLHPLVNAISAHHPSVNAVCVSWLRCGVCGVGWAWGSELCGSLWDDIFRIYIYGDDLVVRRTPVSALRTG